MKKETNQLRQRLLLWTSLAMLLIAAGIFGTLIWSQTHYVSLPGPSVRGSLAKSGPIYLLPQEKDALLEQVRKMRAKWRPWALMHREELAKMLKSPDQTVQLQVYADLPAQLPKSDNATLSADDLSKGPFMFTWNAGTKKTKANPPQTNDPRLQRAVQSEIEFAQKQLDKDYKDYKDIGISRSINIGRTYYVLWASGRVTTYTAKDWRSKTTKKGVEGQHTEVDPPFDFLSEGEKK